MDALWYARHRRTGGEEGPLEWEFGGVHQWDDTSAPGKLGKRLVEGLLDRPVPDRYAALTQNVVHWGTGLGWGALFGVAAGSDRRSWWSAGIVLGSVAWLTAYAVLPATGLYKPLWEYDAKTLADDLSAHVVYGLATAAAFAGLVRRTGDRRRDPRPRCGQLRREHRPRRVRTPAHRSRARSRAVRDGALRGCRARGRAR
jgi:hypothetical protein